MPPALFSGRRQGRNTERKRNKSWLFKTPLTGARAVLRKSILRSFGLSHGPSIVHIQNAYFLFFIFADLRFPPSLLSFLLWASFPLCKKNPFFSDWILGYSDQTTETAKQRWLGRAFVLQSPSFQAMTLFSLFCLHPHWSRWAENGFLSRQKHLASKWPFILSPFFLASLPSVSMTPFSHGSPRPRPLAFLVLSSLFLLYLSPLSGPV